MTFLGNPWDWYFAYIWVIGYVRNNYTIVAWYDIGHAFSAAQFLPSIGSCEDQCKLQITIHDPSDNFKSILKGYRFSLFMSPRKWPICRVALEFCLQFDQKGIQMIMTSAFPFKTLARFDFEHLASVNKKPAELDECNSNSVCQSPHHFILVH